jgi:hypothetical protein
VTRQVGIVGLLAVALLVGSAPSAGSDTPKSVSSYFLARGDPRLCPSPLCGGLFVRLVNRSRTICGDGTRQLQCYVASADLDKLGVTEQQRIELAGQIASGRALARGTIVRGRVDGFPQLDTLVVSEVWPASSSRDKPVGVFRRLRDNGIRCIAAPCFSTDATALNRGGTVTVSRVGLAGTGAPTAERNRALALISKGGLIATGVVVAVPKAGPAGTGRVLVASQFYVRAG